MLPLVYLLPQLPLLLQVILVFPCHSVVYLQIIQHLPLNQLIDIYFVIIPFVSCIVYYCNQKSTNLYKIAIQPDYPNALMRYNNHELDGHQQLSRRESYPNLVCVLH